jgi:hypothetical protein
VRLLLDEMLSTVIARELLTRGHDVQAVAGHRERDPSLTLKQALETKLKQYPGDEHLANAEEWL